MPVRVRCRCGQELVLRYGDWVYFFLGLALLCLVVNMLAVLLLYLRLEGISRSRDASSAQGASIDGGRSTPGLELLSPAAGDGPRRDAAPELGPGGPAMPEPPPPPRAPSGSRDSPPPAAAPNASGGRAANDGNGRVEFKAGTAPPEPGSASGSRSASGSGSGSHPLVSLDSVAEVFLPPGPTSRSAALQEATALAAKNPSAWVDEPSLLRLYLLEASAESQLFAHAFLSDPDARLRALALKKARRLSESSSTDQEARRRLVEAAWEFLRQEPDGRWLMAAFGVQGPAEAGGERGGRTLVSLEDLRARLEESSARALSDAAPSALKEFVAKLGEQGADVLLLVDSSESMRKPLSAFQAQAEWLLPALSWALPGIRVGAVIYRDEVEASTGFGAGPATEVLEAIRQARPEGGGDVPEGVHLALRAALELGRFNWRPAARKIIVVLGDAPPPHQEVPGLLSLASRAFQQGGYRVHALGFEPEEGRSAVPFFPDLARSGGGRAVTVRRLDDVALELVRSMVPADALVAAECLLPALRTLGSLPP